MTGTEFRLAEAALGAPFRFRGTNRVFAPWRLCVKEFPLEDMDWVVDCRHQKLIPNPEHKHGELSDEF